jgi:hypothetical protein
LLHSFLFVGNIEPLRNRAAADTALSSGRHISAVVMFTACYAQLLEESL